MKYLTFFAFAMMFLGRSYGQTLRQYFDGSDTNATTSLIIKLDTGYNTWQIGPPQKTIFNAAATVPNVIVTDTIHTYPVNDSSTFRFVYKGMLSWGVLAIQWRQKLDMDHGRDGGIIEFSWNDSTWHNAFTSPYVHNFYGFDSLNRDTLPSGDWAFTGTDSMWRDIWFCFDMSFVSTLDSLIFRFRLKSDSVDSMREGWMIDNMMARMTFVHGLVRGVDEADQIKIYPTPTTGIVNIEAPRRQEFQIIKKIRVVDMQGRILDEYGPVPTKFFIDIGNHPPGMYYIQVETNLQTTTTRVLLNR